MSLRKKKPQQNDEEKLQALLQSWNIPLPDKKSDFPETSRNDFPEADFPKPQTPPESIKENINLNKEISEPEIPKEKINLNKKIPEEKINFKKEIPVETFFGEQKKKPVTPESILKENPDLDKLFKKQVIQFLHGTVRMITFTDMILPLLMIGCGIQLLIADHFLAIFSIPFLIMAFIWIWYIFSWKLTFNGETNRFSYSSLFHQETHFHASEIQHFKIEPNYFRSSLKYAMILTVHQQKIIINLGYPYTKNHRLEYLDSCPDAIKLHEYLNIYQELHGEFHYSSFAEPDRISDSSAKQELMDLLSKYQNQIDQKNKE